MINTLCPECRTPLEEGEEMEIDIVYGCNNVSLNYKGKEYSCEKCKSKWFMGKTRSCGMIFIKKVN